MSTRMNTHPSELRGPRDEQGSRVGAILVGLNEPDVEQAGLLLSRHHEYVSRSRRFTIESATTRFEGMRIQRVYLTSQAATRMPDELSAILTRTMAASRQWEGFYLLNEDGSIYGPDHPPKKFDDTQNF